MKDLLVWAGLLFFLYICIFNDKPQPSYKNPESTYEATAEVNDVETYQPISPKQIYGYECTDDCSGHEAGRNWAEENSIEDPEDCGGNSQSFIEGCQSYAEEQQEENKPTEAE